MALVFVVLMTGIVGYGSAAQDDEAIINSAEALFLKMKARDYRGLWDYLSAKSQKSIVRETLKAINKASLPPPSGGEAYTPESVEKDFASGGPISKGYWDGYLTNFDPDLALEQSKWTMGPVEKDRAEVIIKYKKSEQPAHLQMVREKGKWRVALIETFEYSAR